jgi:SOS-response transcriptional repressor LexA
MVVTHALALPRLDVMSATRIKQKPSYGLAIAARRTFLGGKSAMDIENETGGVIYQKLLYRIEGGDKHPLELDLKQFAALLQALDWTPAEFARETGVELPTAAMLEPSKEAALQALERMEVHPDWVPFQVYGSVSAGDKDPEPLEGEVAYFPLEKLIKKGAKPKDVRVYLVNGDCMISPEAARVEKNIAPYDYIAVDTGSRAVPGDVVVAYWPKEDKMVVKRYRIEAEGIVLSPVKPGHPNVLLDHEDSLMIIGRVVMRTG